MSKRNGGIAVSYAVDEPSSGDDEMNTISAPGLMNENTAPTGTKRSAGRPRLSPASKSSRGNKTRRTSGAKGATKPAARSKKTKTDRAPLKEIPNTQPGSETEEVDEFDLEPDPSSRSMSTPMTATKQSVPARGAAVKQRGRPRVRKSIEADPETQQDVSATSNFGRTTATSKPPRPVKRETIPETQPESMDLDPNNTTQTRRPNSRGPSTSRSRPISHAKRRQAATSDSERTGDDPALRRKLGEVTKMFEALDVKYRNLRELTEDEGQSNFDKLKQLAQENKVKADRLIASLRSDLEAKSRACANADQLRDQVAELKSNNDDLTASNKAMTTSLTNAQQEIKALQAKLAATRSASEQGATRGPGDSAVKGSQATRTMLVGSAEAVREAQKRVLKEELYSDLTDLVIRDVRRKDEDNEDTFDCLQTGTNGTLHFHLTVPNPLPSGTAFHDAEFEYTPLLDEARDRELLEILPSYLTEDICFPRSVAAKFYSRLGKSMNAPREVAEGEQEGMH